MQNIQSFVRKGWLRPPKSPKKTKTKQKKPIVFDVDATTDFSRLIWLKQY